jgi:phospholipase C
MSEWPRHIVVLTQENHSFDQIFGDFPGAAGMPPDVEMPAGRGRVVRPYYFSSAHFPFTFGPPHSFRAVHMEWDRGRLDGFVRVGGRVTMGRYRADDVASYHRWARQGVLLDHYFCSVLGPTLPNRLYLVAGTAGGLRDDPALLSSQPVMLETVFDQLSRRGVPWRYYVGDLGPDGRCRVLARSLLFCPLLWIPRFRAEPDLARRIVPLDAFYEDLARGDLPAVAFLAPSLVTSGHPPLGLTGAMAALDRVAGALARSPVWDDVLLIVNLDEAGGFFDHIPPPVRDVFGPGFRVPCILLSGRLAPGVHHAVFDHTSVLRFIEEHFDLPLLGSRTRDMNSLQVALRA